MNWTEYKATYYVGTSNAADEATMLAKALRQVNMAPKAADLLEVLAGEQVSSNQNYIFNFRKVFALKQTLTKEQYDRCMEALLEIAKATFETEDVALLAPEQARLDFLSHTRCIEISPRAAGFDARFMSTLLELLYSWYEAMES